MTTPWSNGPIEGQINRLKAIKPQMYGRAGFELLKARVLPWDASAQLHPAPKVRKIRFEYNATPVQAIFCILEWQAHAPQRHVLSEEP